jgi:hypothetical protein
MTATWGLVELRWIFTIVPPGVMAIEASFVVEALCVAFTWRHCAAARPSGQSGLISFHLSPVWHRPDRGHREPAIGPAGRPDQLDVAIE